MSKDLTVKRFLSEDNFQWLIVVCCTFVFIGFVCSRAIASIGMVALLVSSLLYNGLGETLKKYSQRKELLVLSLFFLIVFLSGIYSEDKASWLNWVRIKLPYLALPISFAPVRRLEERKFIALLYGFVITLFISVAIVLSNYFFNYSTITESFLQGNAIPLPFSRFSGISHIRYTLMVTFAFFCSCFLVEKKMNMFSAKEKWVQLFLLVFSFGALHILSVRSSLLALYLGIFFLLLRFVFVQKKYAIGIIMLLALITIPFTAYKFIPSLKNKIEYMKYDYHSFKNGEVSHLSDGVRVVSMQGGLKIAKQNLWLGVGAGDLKTEMNKFYNGHYPQLSEADHKLPHSQLIWVLATTGITGLALFLFAFSFPMLVNGNYKNWLFVVFHLILFSSFFTEATLEEQIGTGFYLTFLLVLMNQFRHE